MKNNLTIKCWAEDDRPREKLQLKGRSALSDAELIAILLGTGSQDRNAVDVAKELLMSSGNCLTMLSKAGVNDLKKIKGIGEAKALTLMAALELGRRRRETIAEKKPRFSSSQQVYEHMRPFLGDLNHEEFHILFLSRANELISQKRISIGGMSGTVADGKLIFKSALEASAHAIILVHNHPSGQLTPSDADKSLTRKLTEFGKCIDLPVLDHVIFTDNGYFSFADQGLI